MSRSRSRPCPTASGIDAPPTIVQTGSIDPLHSPAYIYLFPMPTAGVSPHGSAGQSGGFLRRFFCDRPGLTPRVPFESRAKDRHRQN